MATWTMIDGEWGVRVEGSSYHWTHLVGMPMTVTTKAGKKSHVILGEHVRMWLAKGGKPVYLFKVDAEATEKYQAEWAQAEAEHKATRRFAR